MTDKPPPFPLTCQPLVLHYLIPTVATIFGVMFLLIGVSTGGWLFYSVGGLVLVMAFWGFGIANRHLRRQEQTPSPTPDPEINRKIHLNPLQRVTPIHIEDPTPPV